MPLLTKSPYLTILLTESIYLTGKDDSVKGGVYEWRTITDKEVKAALERYFKIGEKEIDYRAKGARAVDSF